jgi:hypothetical protein
MGGFVRESRRKGATNKTKLQTLGYYKIVLKEKGWDGLEWTDVTQDRDKWPVCKHGDKPSVSIKCGEISWLREELPVSEERVCSMVFASTCKVLLSQYRHSYNDILLTFLTNG